MSTRLTRALGVAGAAGLVAAVMPAAAAQAASFDPPYAHTPGQFAAAWLADALVGTPADHLVLAGTSTPDIAGTAQAVLGMDAAGVAHDAANRATTWLETQAAAFIGTAPAHPGRAALLLLVADAEHVDAHSFGGVDLVTAITGTENADGWYDDSAAASDADGGPASQGFALVALSGTGDPADAPDQSAVDWLVAQQCADGGFSATPVPDPATCTSDLVATAAAVQGLLEVGVDVSAAVTWLDGQANADGGYGDPVSNAVVTAAVAQALLAAGEEPTGALLWLQRHQVGQCEFLVQERDLAGAVRMTTADTEANDALLATPLAAQALALAPLAAIDAGDSIGATPYRDLCGVAGGSGGGPQPHRHPHVVENKGIEEAGLPATGPAPVAPSLLLSAGLLLSGGVLTRAGRRRIVGRHRAVG